MMRIWQGGGAWVPPGIDLIMDAPTPVSDKQLKELGIAVVVPKRDA